MDLLGGLESYWEQFFEADISGEVIDLLQAEQRCGQLEKELVKITSYSGVSWPTGSLLRIAASYLRLLQNH